jgi:hypothetical protein
VVISSQVDQAAESTFDSKVVGVSTFLLFIPECFCSLFTSCPFVSLQVHYCWEVQFRDLELNLPRHLMKVKKEAREEEEALARNPRPQSDASPSPNPQLKK